MKKFTAWLDHRFAPIANKMLANPWIASISSAFSAILPFILVGSFISLYGVVIKYLPGTYPDISSISNFSMNMISLLIVFIIPYVLMDKKGHSRYKMIAGLLGVVTFLMALHPTFEDGKLIISFMEFGPGGALYGLIIALLVSAVFNFWINRHFLENSDLPDFLVEWINGAIPTLIVLLLTHICVFILNVNISATFTSLLAPIFIFGQSYMGLLVVTFIPAFLYSLGIGTRTTSAFRNPIYFAGLAANIAALEQGLAATNIVTFETIHTGALICLGGTGATLTLVVMMCFSRSKRLRTVGRVGLVPSIFNINEPIVYGAPVVFNPLLMIPMWINPITTSTIVYFSMRFGLLNIPSFAFQAWELPAPIGAILATEDIRAIFVWLLVVAVTALTWWPFFKEYEKQMIAKESADEKDTIIPAE